MDEFIKDRNEAIMSMDVEKIKAYCNKYDIEIPEDETVFWAGIHKTICELYLSDEEIPISLEQYNKSFEWLCKHGYTPSIL